MATNFSRDPLRSEAAPLSSYAAGHCEGDTARHEAIRGAGKLVAEWRARTGRKPLNVQAVF